MQQQNSFKSPNHKKLWLTLALISAIIVVGLVWISSSIRPDCSWDAPALSWVDENGNGQWDAGELPLEGVQFHINDTRNHYQDVGGRSISDWNGRANVFVWLPGCPAAHFEVYAVPPTGYQLTTSRVIQIAGLGYGNRDSIYFGFSRLAGFPSPTPYAPSLTCKVYPQPAQDISTASDGSVWTVYDDQVARYDPDLVTWHVFTFTNQGPTFFDRIQIGADNTVWVSKLEFVAARFQAGTWDQYNGEHNFMAATEPSIGQTPSGEIWFAPQAPPDTLAAFNPASNSWRVYYSNWGTHETPDSVRLVTDGSVWRAAFGDRSSLTPTLETDAVKWTIYDRHTFTDSEIQSTPLEGWINDAAIAPNGVLWIAYSFGLGQLDPTTNEWSLYNADTTNGALSEAPKRLAVAPDGSVWVAASGGAHSLAFQLTPALWLNQSAGWRKYDPRDGIPDAEIDSIEASQDGSIWFGFNSQIGIARCTPITP
jgi:ligand-binding sensor domain-containing protein